MLRPHRENQSPGPLPRPMTVALPGLPAAAVLALPLLALPLLALALLAGAAAPLAAQEELPGIFNEIIDVRVVNLEVVVTDRRGDRVTGLTPSDFRLLVDGEEVPIDFFSEILGGRAVVAQRPDGAAAPPSLTPGEAVGTSYLVFIDEFFALERDRDRVLEGLREQLPLLTPEDRMAVVAYDGRKLEMLSSWSNSIAGLERTLKEATRRPAMGLKRVQEYRTIATTRGLGAFENAAGDVGRRLTPEERDYGKQLEEQIKRQVSAASATMRSFAQPPGRKVMLLLSGGWAFDPGQVAAGSPFAPVLDTDIVRGWDLFKPLADTANLLGYTLYPVDVPGLQGSFVEVSQERPQLAGQSSEQQLHTPLALLAEETGGKALLNSLREDSLDLVAADTRSYYWLGFTPQRQRDDVGREIEIEVLRDGLRVRSRESYLDFSRQTEVTAMVESTLLFGNAPPSGVLPVELGELRRAGRGTVEAPLTIAIPVDEITILPWGDGYRSELELRLAVLDEDGNRAEIPVVPIQLAGDEQPSAGGYVRYDTSVTLRRKKHDLVISLFDPASGRLLTSQLAVDP